MKKIIKNLTLMIIMLIMISIVVATPIYAAPTRGTDGSGTSGTVTSTGGASDSHSASEIVSEGKSFIQKGEAKANSNISEDNLKGMSNTIYNILLVTGIIISVIIGLVLGIKFMLGSLEEKAEIKGMLIAYVIGNVVIFGAFTIWKIVVDILQTT